MKKNMFRLLSLGLVIIMLVPMLVACGSGSGTTTTVAPTVGETVIEDPVPRLDWSGRPLNVLTVRDENEPSFEVVGEAGADKLSAKVFERNMIVQEYCNVEIKDVTQDNDNLAALDKDFLAGTQCYDLVFLYRDNMSTAIQKGYMKDITELEYVNLENEWYNPLAVESMKISGRLYHLVSDFSLIDKARTNVLYYNRDLANTLQLTEDVVGMVRDGSWTIADMYEMIKKARNDTNGDNSPKYEDDMFGVVCGGSEGTLAFYSGMGNMLVSFDNNGAYEVKMMEERSIDCLTAIKSIFNVYDWSGFTGSESAAWTKNYDAPYDTFVDGRALFYSGTMGTLDSLASDAKFAYTAITYPKWDTDQESYYTTNDNRYTATFGVPYMAGDMAFCGYMIEVLSWKSHDTTYPEYYEVKCLVQKSYDPVCAEMVELNYNGLVFDFGLIFCDTVKFKKAVEDFTVYKKEENKGFVDYYNNRKEASEIAIQGILDKMAELP